MADLVARTSCLTFRLEADAPAGLDAKLSALPDVTRVELGRPGERELAVRYRDGGGGGEASANATQIAVLQALSGRRGRDAGDVARPVAAGQVIEITRPSAT